MRHGGFADPAESQAGERDAELHGGDEVVELLMELLDGARADAVRSQQLLEPGLADADHGEFGGDKKCVRCDQQDHCHDPQHNESNHQGEILSPES